MKKKKLTEQQYQNIRDDKRTLAEIGIAYDRSHSVIWEIKNGVSGFAKTEGCRKIPKDKLEDIRKDFRTQAAIAKEYGVSRTLIKHIKEDPNYGLSDYRGWSIGDKVGNFEVIGKATDNKWTLRCLCGGIKVAHPAGVGAPGNVGTINYCDDCTPLIYEGVESVKYAVYRRYSDGDITLDQFIELSGKPCHYCGTINSNTACSKSAKNQWQYNGLDRINSNEGHTLQNCVPCCTTCNTAKLDMTQEEFYRWIDKVVNYTKQNK